MLRRIVLILAMRPWEGRRSMRTATIVSLLCVAGALSGCGSHYAMNNAGPGQTVEFVAANADSVLLDFGARPPGELTAANDTAVRECQIFNRNTAVLESLNVRHDEKIRATYLCKN
jgi:hypothetical protein